MEGYYTVVITDTNKCSTGNSIIMNAPITISFDMNPVEYGKYNISCYGKRDGAFEPWDSSGGVGNLKYLWTNSLGDTIGKALNISHLKAGIYSLLVTDQQGCFNEQTDTLTQPDSLEESFITSVFYNQYQISCYGLSDGFIDLSVTGGQGNYKYFWTKDTGNVKNQNQKDLSG